MKTILANKYVACFLIIFVEIIEGIRKATKPHIKEKRKNIQDLFI